MPLVGVELELVLVPWGEVGVELVPLPGVELDVLQAEVNRNRMVVPLTEVGGIGGYGCGCGCSASGGG